MSMQEIGVGVFDLKEDIDEQKNSKFQLNKRFDDQLPAGMGFH